MKKTGIIALAMIMMTGGAHAADKTITSPDGKVQVVVSDSAGLLTYSVGYDGKEMLKPSRLGLTADFGDLTTGLRIVNAKDYDVDKSFDMTRTKRSHIDFHAKASDIQIENGNGNTMTVTFVVADNDIAYRYTLPRQKDNAPQATVIRSEATSFNFPDSITTTFLCPQAKPMSGWSRTKPSYEEEYTADAPMDTVSAFGVGYTFPCLFHIGTRGWALVSETGVDAHYVASRLSDYHRDCGYTIAYPQAGENNGNGTPYAAVSLPCSTPWRTITLGSTLKPIVETTIQYAVVEPKYEPTTDYKPGRYTWSWLLWQDESINYDDQRQFIDLANYFGYEHTLIDNWWDQKIGRDSIERLARYAKYKNVSLMLWYNSNGTENDAPQTPRDIMSDPMARRKEMRWLQRIGVSGIKVDFFGGDKQESMKLYEDILSDANDYGLEVIFHGATIPRGWERMYPNYISSEAALASENVMFDEHHARQEGFEMTMHPFARNAVGSFDWGGVIMNDFMSRDNASRHRRYTSRLFELATTITNQTSVNCVAITPNVVDNLNYLEKDFLHRIPVDWSDTRFIDGYPTRYAIIARKDVNTGRWYVGGINGTTKAMAKTISLPMLAGEKVALYYEDWARHTHLRKVLIPRSGTLRVNLPAMGGFIIEE